MNLTQLHVFFAEDDPDECELFEGILQKNGVTTPPIFKHDGEAAVTYLKTCDPVPGLIFLDINIPRKNGLTVLREIMEDKRLASIPVVIFSTSNNPLSVQQAHLLGASLYAYKPVDMITYKALIKKILERVAEGVAPGGPMGLFIIG
jgi:CheY-like chemotaxis protein